MNKNGKYSIIVLVAISIVSVGIINMSINNDDVETVEEVGTYTIVNNLYFTVDLEEQKQHSQDIVKGQIIGKTNILEYRDVDGNFLSADAKNIAETEPYIIYTLTAEQIIRSTIDNQQEIYTFKVFGGDLNGHMIYTDVLDYDVGDNVVVILTEAFDGKHQELVSGGHSIYQIENGNAIGAENQTEKQLLDKLSQ